MTSVESYGAGVSAGVFRGHRNMRVPSNSQIHLPTEQQVLSPNPTEQVLELEVGNVKWTNVNHSHQIAENNTTLCFSSFWIKFNYSVDIQNK